MSPVRRKLIEQSVAVVVQSLEARRLFAGAADVADQVYAETGFLPRSLTPTEREYIANNPVTAADARVPSTPPSGPVNAVAEYDPMEGLVISYTGSASWLTNLRQIAARVTVEANSRMYVGVPTGTNLTTVANAFASSGVNNANVTYFNLPLNSIWARDYGPRYVYEGNVRVITDHRYNRPTRTADDNQPVVFGQLKNNKYYEIGLNGTTLVHGGGNYHLATDGDAYATQLITNENPSFTAAQVQQIWATYQNNITTITAPFPTSVDATQHIDMWMQIYGDKKVFISDWPSNVGSTQDVICDNTATLMASRGYAVTRVPAYSIGGTHYTFTNMVICNNVVLLPQYNNGPGAAVSTSAFNTIQAAFGAERTVFQINADNIITAAGAFHCIVQHVPKHLGETGANGGLAPTAYLREISGSFRAGDSINLEWISDDDGATTATSVQGVDILLSTDGGRSFDTSIATNRPALGSFLWTVPAGIDTDEAVIRVVARDSVNNTGFDDNDVAFSIDSIAPALANGDYTFETEQLVTVTPSETAVLSNPTLTNLTTSTTLSGSDLTITQGATIGVRKTTGQLADGNWRLSIPAGGLVDSAGNPSTSPFTVDFFVFACDANRDRTVNINDFSILAARFNQPGTFSQGDFNYDGVANINDFSILAAKFNTTLPAARTFREPIASAQLGRSQSIDRESDLIDDLFAADERG